MAFNSLVWRNWLDSPLQRSPGDNLISLSTYHLVSALTPIETKVHAIVIKIAQNDHCWSNDLVLYDWINSDSDSADLIRVVVSTSGEGWCWQSANYVHKGRTIAFKYNAMSNEIIIQIPENPVPRVTSFNASPGNLNKFLTKTNTLIFIYFINTVQAPGNFRIFKGFPESGHPALSHFKITIRQIDIIAEISSLDDVQGIYSRFTSSILRGHWYFWAYFVLWKLTPKIINFQPKILRY